MKYPSFTWTLGLCLFSILRLCAEPDTAPDLILFNGHIVTVDSVDSIAEAMSIKGDRIQSLGTNSRILESAGPETRQIDLLGRTVLPGLIDSHTHPLGACLIEYDHPIPDMENITDVLDYITERTQHVPKGEWIVVQQVFITRLEERRYPNRDELDSAAPDHPVVFRTGPDASLNSLALAHFDIHSKTPEPDGTRIEKDPLTGEPTGILRGWSALIRLPGEKRQPSKEDQYARLNALFKDYNSVGLTAVIDRNASVNAMELYTRMKEHGDLTLRIGLSRAVGNRGTAEDMIAQVEAIAKEPLSQRSDNWLRTLGVKMFLDGGMLTGSAFMMQPWGVSQIYGIDDPGYRGLRFINQADLYAVIASCVKNNLQFTAHSVGDAAVTALVDAYSEVDQTLPIASIRPNITHCNFLTKETIDRMSLLGISADIQPAWLYLDGKTLSIQFDANRMTRFQPLKTLFTKGVRIGGGSDHMQKIGSFRSINPYNPFLGMWIAITRQSKGLDNPLNPEESLTRMEALRFYTINNAYLMFMEKDIGSLEVDKFADFIILDRNFLTIDIDDLPHIQVQATYISGKPVK